MELTVRYDPDDDWSGLASKAERRRRQNRLYQRANRLRKHMRRFDAVADKTTTVAATTATTTPSTALTTTTTTPPTVTPLFFFFRDRHALDTATRCLRPGALAALVHLNVLHALALNAAALGIPVDALADYDAVSPVAAAGPLPDNKGSPPPLLAPTALQRAVPHHPWVDLLPLPRLRDNILRALLAGTLDEDAMCCDISALSDAGGAGGAGDAVDAVDTTATAPATAPAPAATACADGRGALTVWGDAWDVRNWEYSPAFLRKYLWLFDGCDEVFLATDSWRARRGERRIGFRTRG